MPKNTNETPMMPMPLTPKPEATKPDLDLDRLASIATEKEAGVLYVAEDPEFMAAGEPWKILLTNPRAASVQRRSQFLEKKWRRENNFKKITLRTPYDVLAKLGVQAVIELAMVHISFGWKSGGKLVTYNTWENPQTLPEVRRLLVDVTSRIDRIAEFFSEAIGHFHELGESEEAEGEG